MRTRFHALLLALAALVPGIAMAEPPVKIGVREGFPFATAQSSGELSGLYVEVLHAIAAQSDTRFDIDILPFPRLRQYLKDGSITAVLAVPNSEMLDDSIAVGDAMEFEVIALGRAGSRVQSIEQLRGKTICLTRSSSLVPELYADKRYLLREVSHHDSCPRMLDAGRVDFIISIPIGLNHLLAQMDRSMADYGEPLVIKRVPVQLLVSRARATSALLQSLRQALEKAKADGSIDAIHARYAKPPH